MPQHFVSITHFTVNATKFKRTSLYIAKANQTRGATAAMTTLIVTFQTCELRHNITVGAVHISTRMWANAQRDGRPAEYRWRPLFNAAVGLTPTTRVSCSNAAKT